MKGFRLIWQDFAVFISFIGNLGARYITIAVSTTLKGYDLSVAQASVSEANPIQRFLMEYQSLQAVTTFAIYGLIFACYFLLRRNYFKNPKSEGQRLVLDAFTLVLLMIFIGDFLNDLAILIGIFVH